MRRSKHQSRRTVKPQQLTVNCTAAISEDESSGSEAGDIPFTKGQGKGKGKSAVEKQLIEEAVQDGEEEENEEMQEEECELLIF